MIKAPRVLLIKCKYRIVRVLKIFNRNQAICIQGVHATMHKMKKYHSNEIFVRATDLEKGEKNTFTSSAYDYTSRILFEVHQNL